MEERESAALIRAIAGRGPYITSVVGEVETVRACRRADVPAAQVAEVLAHVTLIAVDDAVRMRAGAAGPTRLRTLDAIHLATALSVRDALEAIAVYDVRLARAAEGAGLHVLSPS